MRNFTAIVLAAGKGTRFKSAMPKVLHPIGGRPMLYYPLQALRALKAKDIVVVVGHKAEDVMARFNENGFLSFAVQEPQLGTGHAVMCGLKGLKAAGNDVQDLLILSGDVPLITEQTIKALFGAHRGTKGAAPVISFISTELSDPTGYGRVIRDENGRIQRIVEHKDLKPSEHRINEVNAGIYLVNRPFLAENLKKLGTKNAQKEFYLPDLVRLAYESGQSVSALTASDADEVMGINNRVELARAGRLLNQRTLKGLMLNGVSIVDPDATYIESTVKVGPDTTVYPGAYIAGSATIGANATIEQGVLIRDSAIGDNTAVKAYSVIEDSSIGCNASIGPFARLRPGNVIMDNVRIGNFVEVKKTRMGKGAKANHLSYLGDSIIGRHVNIGAGTITCNYDGIKKYTTTIKDNAFIGSDTQLVAPVVVGKGAYVGSGTTVTKNVPAGSLVVTRASERVVRGWAKKRLKKGHQA